MITIRKNQANQLKLSLNRTSTTVGNALIRFYSPSRGIVETEESLTDLGSGFFSFTVSASVANQLIDNTYSYELIQNNETLKVGKVRLLSASEIENNIFDYTLDLTLA